MKKKLLISKNIDISSDLSMQRLRIENLLGLFELAVHNDSYYAILELKGDLDNAIVLFLHDLKRGGTR